MVNHLSQAEITVIRSIAAVIITHRKRDKCQLEMLMRMQFGLWTVAWCSSSNRHTIQGITTAVTTMEMTLWNRIKKTNQLAWRVRMKLMIIHSFEDQSNKKCSSSSINTINRRMMDFLNNTVLQFTWMICKAKMMISWVSTMKKLLLPRSSGKLLNSGTTSRFKRTSSECRSHSVNISASRVWVRRTQGNSSSSIRTGKNNHSIRRAQKNSIAWQEHQLVKQDSIRWVRCDQAWRVRIRNRWLKYLVRYPMLRGMRSMQGVM